MTTDRLRQLEQAEEEFEEASARQAQRLKRLSESLTQQKRVLADRLAEPLSRLGKLAARR